MKENNFFCYSMAIVCLLLSGCNINSIPECDKNIRGQVISPDGAMKAAIIDVQCGATAADASWVVLAESKNEFDINSNRVAVFEGKIESVEWRGGDLYVFYGDARPFEMRENGKGLRILYEGRK